VPRAGATTRRARVVVDLQALQSATTRDRGVGHYVANWARALEALDENFVDAYVLNPALGPPGRLDALVESGKLLYLDDLDVGRVELWHTLSPFDLALPLCAVLAPPLAAGDVRHSATVYDLIPAINPAEELADVVERRHYRTRLEMIRACDALLTLSRGVADDLVSRAGIDEHRVHTIGAAADERFKPATDRAAARDAAIARLSDLGASGPYLLAASGSHPRKNNEALVRAFTSIDRALLDGIQLIITGEVDEPTANHYRYLASLNDATDRVVVAGFVDGDELVTLTQGAEFAIVAGLAEGYGLPIVEAQACATPVICSDIAPFDELVGPDGRFDPRSDASIAAAITRARTDELFRERLRVTPRDTWTDVASRSRVAMQTALNAAPRRTRTTISSRRPRPRLAVMTPLPPAPSGVAGYSFALIDALVRTEKVDVDVFCENGIDDAVTPEGSTLYSARSLGHIERLAGRYDHVVYTLGNSHHHLNALAWLRKRPGSVLAHDVRLTNLYRHEHGEPSMLRGGFEAELQKMYPDSLPEDLGRDGEVALADLDRYGIFMAREVIGRAKHFLVNSKAAAALAAIDAGPGRLDKIGVLPFAFSSGGAPRFVEEVRPAPDGLPGPIAAYWARTGAPPERPVIAHFGIVDPAKEPELLIRAHQELLSGGDDLALAFVGPIGDDLARGLAGLAAELNIAGSVIFTGPLSSLAYEAWLGDATLAVQLRATSNGEASAAVGECLGAGLPTIVSDLGWARELPDDVVIKAAPSVGPSDLATVIRSLLAAPHRLHGLADHARTFARQQSFDRTARALLSAVSEYQLGAARP
jgi:glycosyltransferase involved in cell wall biosynthesis